MTVYFNNSTWLLCHDLQSFLSRPKLERIDEESNQSQTSMDSLKLNQTNSVTDLKRVSGGCFKGCKNIFYKNGSIESVEFPYPAKDLEQAPGGFKLDENSSIVEKSLPETNKPSSSKYPVISDAENCKRLNILEGQIEKLKLELKFIRKELAPPEDRFKFNTLSDKINEINAILTDLKLNCLRLQKVSAEVDHVQETSRLRLHPNTPKFDVPCSSQNAPKKSTCRPPSYCNEPIRKSANKSCKQCDRSTRNRQNHGHNYYEKYPTQNMCNTPRVPTRCYKNREQKLHSTSNFSPPSTTSDSYPFQERYSANDWDFSHNNSNQWAPIAQSTPKYRRFHRLEKPRIKSEFNGHTRQQNYIPMSSTHLISKADRKCSVSPTIKHPTKIKLNHQDPYYNNLRTAATKRRTFSMQTQTEFPSTETPRLSEPLNYMRHRKSAGFDYKFSPTNVSSPVVESRSGDHTSEYSYDKSSSLYAENPLITKNISEVLMNMIEKIEHKNIVLTIFFESNNLYHINVSLILSSQSLGCFYVTEEALQQAKLQNLFEEFLTFFILKSNSTPEQRNTILENSFEFISTSS